jgi:hypothetical protein
MKADTAGTSLLREAVCCDPASFRSTRRKTAAAIWAISWSRGDRTGRNTRLLRPENELTPSMAKVMGSVAEQVVR